MVTFKPIKNMKQTKQQQKSFAYQRIKANDKILETLSELETVLRKLYNPLSEVNQCDRLIFKDREGNEINMYDYLDDLQHFVDRNETMLKRDSEENYKLIK